MGAHAQASGCLGLACQPPQLCWGEVGFPGVSCLSVTHNPGSLQHGVIRMSPWALSVRMLQAAACGNSSVGAHTVKAFLYRARALGLASVNFALPRERALGMKRALSWLRVCDSFTS